MMQEDVLAIVQELGLLDLGDAATYLDEEGSIEAMLISIRRQESEDKLLLTT